MRTGALTALAVLPALSATEALTVRLLPSPVTVASAGPVAASRPERASAAVQCTVTPSRYQPLALGPSGAAPVRVGATVSTLIPVTVAEAVLPATSVTEPVTEPPVTSLDESVVLPTTVGLGHPPAVRPDPSVAGKSWPAKLAVPGASFH